MLKKVGRKTKLNEKVTEILCNALLIGAYMETAAAYANIDKVTFYKWLKKGRANPSSKYGKFVNAIDKAIADSELRDLQTIDRHANAGAGNWKAAAWRLERKFPRKWGRLDRIEATGDTPGSGVVIMLPAKQKLPPEDRDPDVPDST